jgi:cytochrome P450
VTDLHVEFDPYAPSVEPTHAVTAELRQRCPVAHTPSGWFVARHADVKDVLQHVERYTGSFNSSEGFPEDERALMNIDEPEHGRLRKIINGAIAGHRSVDMEPFIRELATTIVDEVLAASAAGPVDLVAAFAEPIPVRVIAKALGVPVSDYGQFQRWADELVARLYDRPPAPYSTLHPEFADYVQELLEERRAGTERDFLSRLLAEGLSDAAVRTHALHLIIAGNETTRSMLGNCCYRLATEPGLFDSVKADLSLVPALIEESLRFDAPIQVMGRTATTEHELDGIGLAPAEHVILGLGAANRDPEVFERPDEFRLDRARPKDHLAFGAGPHVCPGAFLARLEGVTAVTELVSRPRSRRVPDGDEFDGNPMFWSRAPLSLPMLITPDEDAA